MREWRLLIGVALLQIITGLAVRATPLSTWRRMATRLRTLAYLFTDGAEREAIRSEERVIWVEERVIWAIEATGRRLPWFSTCLVRAIVAELLLTSSDHPVHVVIGVRRSGSGVLDAHAWAERDGRTLVGGSIAGLYSPLGHVAAGRRDCPGTI